MAVCHWHPAPDPICLPPSANSWGAAPLSQRPRPRGVRREACTRRFDRRRRESCPLPELGEHFNGQSRFPARIAAGKIEEAGESALDFARARGGVTDHAEAIQNVVAEERAHFLPAAELG